MYKRFVLSLAVVLVACAAGRATDDDEKVVKDLVAVFRDPKNTPEVRTAAVRALGVLGWPGRTAIPDLIKIIDSADERKAAKAAMGPYYQAIVALGRMGYAARSAVPSLVKAKGLGGSYDQAIDQALESILQPPGTAYVLLGDLRDNDPAIRLMAAKALRTYPADTSVVLPALLASSSQDPDLDVRIVAKESARVVEQGEVTRLAQLLKDKDENVRLLAAKALGRMGATAAAAESELKEAADKDTDADVRLVAKNALEKVRAKP